MTTPNQTTFVSDDQNEMPATRDQGLPIKPVKKVDARTRILETALSEFATRGFDGVSTTEIAKSAGVTQPLIHYHFKSKETLWKATVEQVFGWLKEEFAELPDATSVDKSQMLNELVRKLIGFAARHPEAGQFLLREGTQQTDRLEWMTDNLMQPAFDFMAVRYHEAVEEGSLKNVPIAQLSVIITAISTQFFALAPMVRRCYGVEPCDPEQIDILVKLAVDMIKSVASVGHGNSSIQ